MFKKSCISIIIDATSCELTKIADYTYIQLYIYMYVYTYICIHTQFKI